MEKLKIGWGIRMRRCEEKIREGNVQTKKRREVGKTYMVQKGKNIIIGTDGEHVH